MARKTKEEALETRNAILDAAELVFHERGVSATSLAEIAEAAGVTRGAIYWHFVNKEALYDAMIQRVFAPVEAKFAELTQDTDANPIEILRQIALFVVGRVANDPRYSRIIAITWHKCEYVGEMAKIRDPHVECGKHYQGVGEKMFELAKQRGYLPETVDPLMASFGLMVIVDGIIANLTLKDFAPSFPASYAEAIIDVFLAGLQCPDFVERSAQTRLVAAAD